MKKITCIFIAAGYLLLLSCSRDLPGDAVTPPAPVPPAPTPLPPPPSPGSDNVLFYFRVPNEVFSAGQVFEGFTNPDLVLARVTVNGIGEKNILGFYGNNVAPWCPISSIYYDTTSFATFHLPAGTYSWTAQNVINNYTGYPLVGGFAMYWSIPRTASGTITVNAGSACIIKEMVFQ